MLMLTLLLGIQPVTTDLYLPALPALRLSLGASMATVQLTLSALILCFGAGQLVLGPLSDRVGRRPVLLFGLALYVVASVLGALAPSIEALIAWRSLQGLAMGAAVTCARSIVRDLYAPAEGTRVMSRAMTGLGVIAFAGPLVGGTIATWLDWRWALGTLSLFGAAALGFVALRYAETVPAFNRDATRLGPLLANAREILAHPTFGTYALLASATYGGLFTILASTSFVFIEIVGISQIGYGSCIATFSLAYTAGTVLCRRLLARHGVRRTVAIGGAISLAGGLGALALTLAHGPALWTLVPPLACYMVGHGIHQPCAQVGSVGPFREKAGTAAALSGFLMMATAFAVGLLLGRTLAGGSALPLPVGVAFFSLVIAVTAWTGVQRHGEAPAPAAA